MAKEHQRPASQKLPAGLAGVLNPEENRDSAYFSSTDASSKHTSAASIGINVFGPNSYHCANDATPPPINTANMAHPMISPASNMSIHSMVSPATPSSGRFDRPFTLDSAGPNGSHFGVNGGGLESRRESVDSRINQNFGDMRIAGSPYASHNQSTTSIQGSLAQQRNPRSGLDTLAAHRISNGYQPSADRNPDANPKVRTAPAITGPATSNIARAAEPTKGQAWAFPEEEIQRMPSAAGSSYMDSRRSSIADSIASSQFTTESRLPPGQRRLDEGFGADFPRYSTSTTDFPAVVHHHHSLQHKQVSDLHSEESSPQSSTLPYSRTPELRQSHKMAERKRRTEMKELFDQLRDLMPQERGAKASKWEILTKAITDHQRQQDHIKQLSNHYTSARQEIEYLRHELEKANQQNAQMRSALPLNGQAQANGPMPPQPMADSYGQDPYGRGAAARTELPPLRSLNGPDSMTGVQYDGQRPASNGYR